MADNNFRPFRSREPLAREDVDPTSDAARDPLAELARIIGQSDRVNEFGRDPRYADARHAEPRHAAIETLDEPPPAPADRDWAADDGYAEPDAPDQYAQESYVQPRLPEPYPPIAAMRAITATMSAMNATMSAHHRSPANIPSRPSPTTIPTTMRRRTTRAIATKTRRRRGPLAGSRRWRRNLTTTNTKPKTDGTIGRIVRPMTPKTMTTKLRAGPGAAASP